MNSNAGGDQRESFEAANQPVLCGNGCGFFGNPASLNLCSKCYRDYCTDQERKTKGEELISGAGLKDLAPAKAPAAGKVVTVQPASVPAASPLPSAGAGPVTEGDSRAGAAASPGEECAGDDGRPVQKNTTRCFDCNKRVGLTGFKCRCGYVYCATHRYAEKHDCPFDYKTAGRQTLAKNNPLVAAAKIDKF